MVLGSDEPRRRFYGPPLQPEVPFDQLRVAVSEPLPGVLVVSPVGEVDVATASVLRRAGQQAVEIASRAVVVDLDGLTFCGSTGLVLLLECRDAAVAAGLTFGTAGGPPIVRRVLDITGLNRLLGHGDSLEQVLAGQQVR